jgi:hypothetical protein
MKYFASLMLLLGLLASLSHRESFAAADASQSPPPPSAPPTPPADPSAPPPTPSKPDEDPEKIKVWVTPSGKKYHKATCRFAKNATSVTLKEARAKGLTSCKTCGGY